MIVLNITAFSFSPLEVFVFAIVPVSLPFFVQQEAQVLQESLAAEEKKKYRAHSCHMHVHKASLLANSNPSLTV